MTTVSSNNQRRSSHRAVTIRDVAQAAGVSVATVSMVLNGVGRRIPSTTHQLVHEAAERLGYSPNLQARSLRSKRTRSVGVLVFDITDPYCSLMIRGVENSLGEAGYMPVLADLQNKPQRLQLCMQMLMERRVEGLIAIANPVHLGSEVSIALEAFRIPAVMIGSESSADRFASVVVDNRAGMQAAVEHLYHLGHREIAVIKGPRAMSDSAPRWDAVRECAREKGIAIDRSLVVQIQGDNSSYEQGYQLTEQLLECGRRFTALIAFDDLTAFAAIGALSRAGRRVPEDCSVVGFDDIPGAAYYNPPLTTVCQHMEEQGACGAEIMRALLLARPGKTLPARRERVQPHLVVRQSTGPAPR
ncbi:MAG: LacI family DNA-binding transcriptional regulator [Acidobacteriota bacterium]